MIRKIGVFETGDGQFHRTEENAIRHEKFRLAILFDQICPDCQSPIEYSHHNSCSSMTTATGYCRCEGIGIRSQKAWVINEKSEPKNLWKPY